MTADRMSRGQLSLEVLEARAPDLHSIELPNKIKLPMKDEVIAIYPGSFDPVTNGHLDIISRAREIFSRVIVAVLINKDKKPLFTVGQRVEMLIGVTQDWNNVEVTTFDGLLVDYAMERHARVVLRGIRAVTDYDFEFQLALMNRRMKPEIETVFMVPAQEYTYLSSSIVKEVFHLGGSVCGLVPPSIEKALKEAYGSKDLR